MPRTLVTANLFTLSFSKSHVSLSNVEETDPLRINLQTVTAVGEVFREWLKPTHSYPAEISICSTTALIFVESVILDTKISVLLPLDEPLIMQIEGELWRIQIMSHDELRGNLRHRKFKAEHPDSTLWVYSFTLDTYVEKPDSVELRTAKSAKPRKNLVSEPIPNSSQNLGHDSSQKRKTSINSSKNTKRITRKLLHYKNLTQTLMAENKRLKEQFDESQERERIVKTELEETSNKAAIQELKLSLVDSHLKLTANRMNSAGFISPITNTPFRYNDEAFPLKCMNPECNTFMTKKTYRYMKSTSKGAFCSICRSRYKGEKTGFAPDVRTALMGELYWSLATIEENRGSLSELIVLKNRGELNNISKLDVKWEDTHNIDDLQIPEPIYKSGHLHYPQQNALPVLLCKEKFSLPASLMNGLLKFESLDDHLKNQEAGIHRHCLDRAYQYPSNRADIPAQRIEDTVEDFYELGWSYEVSENYDIEQDPHLLIAQALAASFARARTSGPDL